MAKFWELLREFPAVGPIIGAVIGIIGTVLLAPLIAKLIRAKKRLVVTTDVVEVENARAD
jgi:hypothetical protein